MTILFFCREIYAWSWPRRVYFTKIALIPFGWQSYSFVENIYVWSWPRRVLLYNNNANPFRMTILFFCREMLMHNLCQGLFELTKIARLPFGWQSYSLVMKFMLRLSQGVFYCTKIAWLPLWWQSYSSVEKYILSLIQSVLYYTKTAHLPFGWQSYSFVEKYMHGLGQGVHIFLYKRITIVGSDNLILL